MKATPYFIAFVVAVGVGVGLLARANPSLQNAAVPPVVWPVLAALLADVALMPFVNRGTVRPITMNQRLAAVVAAGLACIILTALP